MRRGHGGEERARGRAAGYLGKKYGYSLEAAAASGARVVSKMKNGSRTLNARISATSADLRRGGVRRAF
jgi:hypothetical protein